MKEPSPAVASRTERTFAGEAGWLKEHRWRFLDEWVYYVHWQRPLPPPAWPALDRRRQVAYGDADPFSSMYLCRDVDWLKEKFALRTGEDVRLFAEGLQVLDGFLKDMARSK